MLRINGIRMSIAFNNHITKLNLINFDLESIDIHNESPSIFFFIPIQFI